MGTVLCTMIETKTFNEKNRTKTVGNSMYRICNTDGLNGKGKWYILEVFNDGGVRWSQRKAFYRDSLEDVIDIFNMLSRERQIIDYGQTPPLEPYSYFLEAYEKGMYSLNDLMKKHRKGEEKRPYFEGQHNKSRDSMMNYTVYNDMQKALLKVIKEIRRSGFCLRPVPKKVEMLDLAMEEKKITIVHRALHSMVRKGYQGDSFYHNVRAALINRVEKASDHALIVDLEGANALSVAKVRNRKEYLKEKYGSCQSSLCLKCDETDCIHYHK